MKVLVVGDSIIDQYRFCKATRLCPEACAPVLHIKSEKTCNGGAALVADTLKSLLGNQDSVLTAYGSVSHKERTFADRTLICRVDRDRYSTMDTARYWDQVLGMASRADAIIVSDYAKGAITQGIASGLVALHKPLFVDAKGQTDWYKGCFAIFPNEEEHPNLHKGDFQHIIRKLGAKGCLVDNLHVPTREQQVYDVTGAGDVFLAAFVAKFTEYSRDTLANHGGTVLTACARYANVAAGISVRYLGTHVVTPTEMSVEAS